MKAKISAMKNKVSRVDATVHELDIIDRAEASRGKKDSHKIHRRFQTQQSSQYSKF